MADECIFCNAKTENVLFRGDDGIVIIDDPVRPGHVLVASNAHGESLHDLSAADAAGLMRLANKAAKSIVAITGAVKVYVTAIGDRDKHFHVHLLPKFANDPNLGPFVFGDNGWVGGIPKTFSSHDVDQVAVDLRNTLSGQ